LDQDLASPASAAIFGPLKLDSNGVLIGDQKENMTTIVNSLYQRILRRDPESFEVENMLSFAKEVQSIESQKSGYEWARMACFMTFTSAENIFY
jgi:hypothetical protein